MKKILLSVFVVITFIAYAFEQRVSGSESVSLTAPKSLTQNTEVPSPTQLPESTSQPSSTPMPSASFQSTPIPTPKPQGKYKDGSYTGDVADAFYGNVQVQIVISSGKITDVQFLDYPRDRRTSQEINGQATPMLRQEAIQEQSANVDTISGATQTSLAFKQSLQSAINKAKA